MANTASLIFTALTAVGAGSQGPIVDGSGTTTIVATSTGDAQRVVDAAGTSTITVTGSGSGLKQLTGDGVSTITLSWTASASVTRFARGDTVITINATVPLWTTGGDAWVTNWDTSAASKYENYDFNSFIRVGQRYYGVRADGLYLLGGSTDNGSDIRASVSVGLQRFGSDGIKRLISAYADAASSDKLQLKVSYSTARGPQEYIYAAERANDFQRMQRFSVGRGIKANYMTFEVFNVAGCDFDLNSITVLTSDMVRRI